MVKHFNSLQFALELIRRTIPLATTQRRRGHAEGSFRFVRFAIFYRLHRQTRRIRLERRHRVETRPGLTSWLHASAHCARALPVRRLRWRTIRSAAEISAPSRNIGTLLLRPATVRQTGSESMNHPRATQKRTMQRRPIAGQLSQPSNVQLNFETGTSVPPRGFNFRIVGKRTLDPVVKPKKSTELQFSTDRADRQKEMSADGLVIPGSIAPANPIEERGAESAEGRTPKKGPHPEPDNEESPQRMERAKAPATNSISWPDNPVFEVSPFPIR